ATIRATDAVTVAGPVEVAIIDAALQPEQTTRLPILVAPISSAFTVDDFTLATFGAGTASAVVLEVVADESAGTRTLYLKGDGSRGKMWFNKTTPLENKAYALTNLDQWKDRDGNIGAAGAPTADDELVVHGNSRIRSYMAVCPARSLQLGDSTGWGEMVQDGSYVTFQNDGLRLYHGWWWFNVAGAAKLRLNGRVTVLPTTGTPPAMFYGQATQSNGVAYVTGPLVGSADAQLDIGYHPSQMVSVQNCIYEFHDLADYHGLLLVKARYEIAAPNHGGCLRVKSRTGMSDCQVRLQKSCYISTVETNGVTTIGDLAFEEGSGIRLNGCAEGIGGIAVSGTLTIEKPSVKIPVVWEDFVYGGTPQVKMPVLSWPSDQALTLDNFELVKGAGCRNANISLAIENSTLYVMADARVEQVKALSVNRDTTWNSSLTNAASWSDGRLPHAEADYYTTRNLCSGGQYVDYLFPGSSLELDGGSLWLSTRSFTLPSLTCRNGAQLLCTSVSSPQELKVVANAFVFADQVSLFAHRNHKLVLAGPISGSGEIYMPSHSGTGSPEALYELRGDNTGYKGRIRLNQEERRTHYVDASGVRCFYDMETHFPTLVVQDGRNLGGALDELDRRALTLTGLGRLSVNIAGTVTLAGDLNRGVYISDVGRFHTVAGATLAVEQPVLLGGHMWKEGPGTLILACETKFEETSGGTIVDTPVAESNRFTVAEGVVKIAHVDALQGVATTISNGVLLVAYNPLDVDLLKYGIRNTLIDNPFALDAICAGKLPIAVDVGEFPEPQARETVIGLLTVNATAASGVRTMFAGNALPRAWPNLPGKVKEIANADGSVTFALVCKYGGTSILLR
ncbi:MAG: hypothetical protein MJ240_10630, partial [Kiritimatiellae bacterium]|nr:hypothetical protein [Kiritimatiellia bacterium]